MSRLSAQDVGRMVRDSVHGRSSEKEFSRGTMARAERNAMAEEMKEERGIKNPYALATSMVKKGAKSKNKKLVAKNLKAEKKLAKKAKKK